MRCRSRSRFVPGLVQRSVQAGGVSLVPCCRWARSQRVRAGTTWRLSPTAVRTTTRSSGEVPGRWLGAGSVTLGLDGEVRDEDFIAVLAGVSPLDGEQLCRSNRRVSGLDLTLSAPKSVSVLWALGSASTTTAVAAAHDAAIEATVAFLERTAVKARTGHNGVDQVDGEGLIAAAFRHRTSRAGDPQLHTHVVVANATHCGDGAWRSLDARWIYGYARTAGFLYQAELRRQLTARLGVSWTDVDKGVAEIAGIDRQSPPRILPPANRDRTRSRNRSVVGRSRAYRSARHPSGETHRQLRVADDRLAHAGRSARCRHRGGHGAVALPCTIDCTVRCTNRRRSLGTRRGALHQPRRLRPA